MSATVYSRGRKCGHQPSHLTVGAAATVLHMLGSMAQAWDDDTARGTVPLLHQPSISMAVLRWENSQTR